ncbi:MAG: pilin [Candidatus Pacebacteria bacterium]|nr:pilin [Candidatus Paceibacterota bacterium]
MKKILSISLLVFSVFLLAVPVFAQIDKAFGGDEDACTVGNCEENAFNAVVGGSGYQKDANDPEVIISTILYTLFGFLGVLFIALIIYGGIQWMTASGNDEQVTKAKKVLKSAIIGLVIVLAAYGITWFIFNFLISSGQGFTPWYAPGVN